MKIVGKSSGSKGGGQAPLEAGTYPCRVVQILYLGTQEQKPFQGKVKPDSPELMVTYEFLDEFCVDSDGNVMEDKPRWLSETFVLHALDAELAKSTKRYLALDPNKEHEGDWSKLITLPCNVTITATPGKGKNSGNTYNNISSVTPMRARDAEKAVELVNPPKLFSVDEPDMEVLGSLPDWLQEKIKKAPEMNESPEEQDNEDEDNGSDEPW